MGRCVLGLGQPMRLADSFAVRQPQMPPFFRTVPSCQVERYAKDMTKSLWQPWRHCSEVCQEMLSIRRGPAGSRRCRCAWGWACGLQPAFTPRHVGQTHPHGFPMTPRRGQRGCFAEFQGAARDLDRFGFVGRPSWESIFQTTCARSDGT